MEILSQVVRNLVFLLLFYAFLEMLLPMKEVRKFVQVILGLFIVVTVLNPLISLVKEDFSIKPYDFYAEKTYSTKSLQKILDDGKNLQEQVVNTAKEECRQKLEEQVETAVFAVQGVAEAQAEVKLSESGEVNEILLKVVTEDKLTDFGEKGSSKLPNREEILFNARREAASSIGLNPEKVDIIVINNKG